VAAHGPAPVVPPLLSEPVTGWKGPPLPFPLSFCPTLEQLEMMKKGGAARGLFSIFLFLSLVGLSYARLGEE